MNWKVSIILYDSYKKNALVVSKDFRKKIILLFYSSSVIIISSRVYVGRMLSYLVVICLISRFWHSIQNNIFRSMTISRKITLTENSFLRYQERLLIISRHWLTHNQHSEIKFLWTCLFIKIFFFPQLLHIVKGESQIKF